MLSKVDFPLPEVPIITINSPSVTVNEILSNAFKNKSPFVNVFEIETASNIFI